MPVGVNVGGRGSPSPGAVTVKSAPSIEKLREIDISVNEDDWNVPIYYPKADEDETDNYRVEASPEFVRSKDRMRTNSVALVLCLNPGVDPPDVVKVNPCARVETWIDPVALLAKTTSHKVLEQIGANLQKQYERWQSKARYKQVLDPTMDEVKKLCTSLRKSAKEDRILFHYNGHGVPKPTHNGELWVFNKSYTQYIPLSLYDLHQWMAWPSVYVFDCSGAGVLLQKCQSWKEQHQRDYDPMTKNSSDIYNCFDQCIQIAACAADEILPMDPKLPADVFTACLTTPIQMALRCYVLNHSNNLVPGLTLETVDKLPGQFLDRRSMLGELNWIYTSITDTIAWNVLPRALFQRLFRRDLMLASFFRNYLLAERVLKIYDCTTQSNPALPKTCHHPMWKAWDAVLDNCLRQLPDVLKNEKQYVFSTFFADQLTAFELWLKFCPINGCHTTQEQLPIVLQVLLSQVHRARALELLARFVDLGPWAVSQALSVGIFPYILKLLQSPAQELRPFLVLIWAKILAVDHSYQADLVKEVTHKYFLSILQDSSMAVEYRSMAAFCLSCFCAGGYHPGQKSCIQNHVMSACSELLNLEGPDLHPDLKKWICILLGRIWDGYCDAKWQGIRTAVHDRLIPFLQDPLPEVRAAAVYALGTLLNSQTQRTDHADNIESNLGMVLVTHTQWDASPIVRQELVGALQWLFCVFDTQYVTAAHQSLREEERSSSSNHNSANSTPVAKHNRVKSATNFFVTNIIDGLRTPPQTYQGVIAMETTKLRRISSGNSLSSQSGLTLPNTIQSQHLITWKVMNAMATIDPHENVSLKSNSLIALYRTKADSMMAVRKNSRENIRGTPTSSTAIAHANQNANCRSEPSSPSGVNGFIGHNEGMMSNGFTVFPRSTSMFHSVKMTDAARSVSPVFSESKVVRPRRLAEESPKTPNGEITESSYQLVAHPVVTTDFLKRVTKQFHKPIFREEMPKESCDIESEDFYKAEYRFMRNAKVRKQARKALSTEYYRGLAKSEEQQFVKRLSSSPTSVIFHPFEPLLFASDHHNVVVFDTDRMVEIEQFRNAPPRTFYVTKNPSKMSSTVLVNAHHEKCLLFTATTDGAIRAWADTYDAFYNPGSLKDPGLKKQPSLVTAFNCMLDAGDVQTALRCSGILIDWDQRRNQLITCGDMKVIRLWDMNEERRILDMPLDSELPVRCVSIDKSDGGSLVAVGLMDGSVKLYDRRRPSGSCRSVLTTRDHCGQVVGVHLDVAKQLLTSASVAGDIRNWQLSACKEIKPENRLTQLSCQDLTCMAMHPYFPNVLACGSQTQNIVVMEDNSTPQQIRTPHEWFSGQKIVAAVSTLAFHPYKMSLAVATQDCAVSIYQRKRN